MQGSLSAQKPLKAAVDSLSNVESSTSLSKDQTQASWEKTITVQLQALLAQNRFKQAVAVINDVYRQANARELEGFKQLILRHAEQLTRTDNQADAGALLEAYAATFDDIDAWRELGTISTSLQQWDTALRAYKRVSALEYQPERLAESLQQLIKAAAYLRAPMERQGDQAGILRMYQQLYDLHPGYARFQLELAQAHLRLNDPAAARPYLEALRADPQLGNLASQKLSVLDAQSMERRDLENQLDAQQMNSTNRQEVVLPLVRAGNSFLIDVSINRRPMRLLLDTGASITALSSQTIQRLQLRPTGGAVTLGTANGMRQARLYYTDKIQMGSLQLTNLVVAEIELGVDQQVDGLLGTDALSQVDEKLTYLIDDQRNALIFRTK